LHNINHFTITRARIDILEKICVMSIGARSDVSNVGALGDAAIGSPDGSPRTATQQ